MSNSDPPDGGGVPCTPLRNRGVNIFGPGTHDRADGAFKAKIFATPGKPTPAHMAGMGEESPCKTKQETASTTIREVLTALRPERNNEVAPGGAHKDELLRSARVPHVDELLRSFAGGAGSYASTARPISEVKQEPPKEVELEFDKEDREETPTPMPRPEQPRLAQSTRSSKTCYGLPVYFIFTCVHLFSSFPFSLSFTCVRLLLQTVHCGLCTSISHFDCRLWTVPTVASCIMDL
jgi:hypothetical protein